MSSSFRSLASVGLLLAALAGATGLAQTTPAQPPAPPAADQPPDQAQPPVFRTGINFVRVDVVVTDDGGNPVLDLKAEDFRVVEDGRPQTIETFQLIELDGGLIQGTDGPPRPIRDDSDQEIEAAREDVRLFAIFLDDYHVRWENGVKAREELARFVETQLGPSDMVGLMYPLEPTAGVRFTRDHAAVTRALRRFDGRKGNYDARNEIEQRYAYQPTEVVERIRTDVSLSAIQALIVRMGSLKEGRKSLILFTEGYTYMVPPQLRSRVAGVPDLDNPAAGDPNAGVGSRTEQLAGFQADTQMNEELRELTGMANRNNVAIYGVDPRGLAASEFDISTNIGISQGREYLNSTMETIRVLSLDTAGRPIVNRNDLTMAMKQIVVDASSYYLLGYNSTSTEADGRFHEIDVRTTRRNVQLRARTGYWALKPEEAIRLTAAPRPGPPPAVAIALAAIAVPDRGRLLRTWIGSERGESGATRVTLFWEPTTPTPGDRTPRGAAPIGLMVIAAGADGTPYYRGRVAVAASRVTFEAPPGDVELRLTIQGPDAEVLDSLTQSIVVPDLTTPQTALGTPAMFRGRTARAIQDIRANPQALPTTAREFNRTERVLIKVPAYGPGGSTPTVTARLLNRSGEPMSELPVVAAPGVPAAIEVPLAGLAVGDYLVEIVATGEAGQATELVGFRVG